MYKTNIFSIFHFFSCFRREIRPPTRKSHQNSCFLLLFTTPQLKMDHIFQEKDRFSNKFFFWTLELLWSSRVCNITTCEAIYHWKRTRTKLWVFMCIEQPNTMQNHKNGQFLENIQGFEYKLSWKFLFFENLLILRSCNFSCTAPFEMSRHANNIYSFQFVRIWGLLFPNTPLSYSNLLWD